MAKKKDCFYYLDTEWYDTCNNRSPHQFEVITIQIQRITLGGWPRGPLFILKAWESSERAIVDTAWQTLTGGNPSGIPKHTFLVGHGVSLDKEVLRTKLVDFGFATIDAWEALFGWRSIDTKDWPVFLQGGNPYGTALDKWTNKVLHGDAIPALYQRKDYAAIEKYIQNETSAFLEFYRYLCKAGIPIGQALKARLQRGTMNVLSSLTRDSRKRVPSSN